MKNFTLLLVGLLFATICSLEAQNTFPSTGAAGIGTTSPNASSLLDVTSTTKGVLVPRMTKTQRDAIASPTEGLLIYQTNNTPGLYYYEAGWNAVTTKAGASKALDNLTLPTAVNIDLLPATTNTLNLGSSTLQWKDVNLYDLKFADGTTQTTAFTSYISGSGISISGNTITNTAPDQTVTLTSGSRISVTGAYPSFTIAATGGSSGANTSLSNLTSTSVNQSLIPSTNNSIDLGSSAKKWKNVYAAGSYYIGSSKVLTTSGTNNTFVGATGNTTNTGPDNVFVGSSAGLSNTSGQDNVVNGDHAFFSNTTGSFNTAIGHNALYHNTTGSSNIANGAGALSSNTTGFSNTANGDHALNSNTTGYKNSAYGDSSLFSNSTANFNTANGYQALFSNTTGSYNTANGYQALYSNIPDQFDESGSYNTANGYRALFYNTIGSDNTANGYEALYSNTTGVNNAANGYQALYSNTTGIDNYANGVQALYSNTTGNFNTAMGFALFSNTTGSDNTANGLDALYSNRIGDKNTAIGELADVSSDDYNNSSVFGYNALITASNQVRIGNGSVTSIGGYKAWSNISDGRVKKNIKENVPGLEFINLLKPITYTLDLDAIDKIVQRPVIRDKDGKPMPVKEDSAARAAQQQVICTGFIAQDVEASAKKIGYDFDGVDAAKNDKDLYGLRYAEFVVPLVKAVQELSVNSDAKDDTIKSLQSAVGSLQKENTEIKNQIAQLQSSISNQQSSTTDGFARAQVSPFGGDLEGALLGQNIPNPFDNSTLIPFRIPKDCKDASIMVTNTSLSEVVSVIPISCNEDHISVDAGVLASGTYSYTLYVDGKMIDTKSMVLTK